MCQGIVVQEHPVFGHLTFRMLQVKCLLQIDKHPLVPLLADHSTIRNKLKVHYSQ